MLIEASNTNERYKFNIHRRLNIIKGNSGIGKTAFYELIETNETNKNSGIKLKSPYPIRTCTVATWKSLVTTLKNTILVCDEFDVINSGIFSEYYKKYIVDNNLWFIIMARVDAYKTIDTNNYKKLSYSVSSIYTLQMQNGFITNIPYYDNSLIRTKKVNIDCIVVEDSKSGFTFLKYLFGNKYDVVSAEKGKSYIINKVKQVIEKGKKNILIFADMSAFGCHIEEFDVFNYYSNVNIYFIDIYECFEYLLLSTNLLRNKEQVLKEFKNIEMYANQFSSWEKYFENLIIKVTEGRFYKQSHRSKLNSCYYENCNDCNTHKKEKCDYGLEENKFINLLVGTRFEFLLRYL